MSSSIILRGALGHSWWYFAEKLRPSRPPSSTTTPTPGSPAARWTTAARDACTRTTAQHDHVLNTFDTAKPNHAASRRRTPARRVLSDIQYSYDGATSPTGQTPHPAQSAKSQPNCPPSGTKKRGPAAILQPPHTPNPIPHSTYLGVSTSPKPPGKH